MLHKLPEESVHRARNEDKKMRMSSLFLFCESVRVSATVPASFDASRDKKATVVGRRPYSDETNVTRSVKNVSVQTGHL